MQSEMPADPTPAPGPGEDAVRRVMAAPPSLPGDEDEQTERAELVTSSFEPARLGEAAFQWAAAGLAVVSPEGRWLRFNQRLCDLLGYNREELEAHTWQELTHPDDRNADLDCFRRALAGEIGEYAMDKRYIRKDGAPVWVHLNASLVRTPQGEPDYFTTTQQDITERKRLERERAQLQALTDTALSHLLLDDLLRELLGRVTAVMGVDNVAILLLNADSQTLTVRAARGVLEGEALGRVQVPVGQGVSGRIAATREPLIVDDLATFEEAHPLLREHVRSAVGVPLLVEDQVEGHLVSRMVGVIHVGSAAPRRFTQADVQLLQRVADRIALAISRALVYAAEQDARQRAEAALARAVVSETQATDRAERLRTILETMAEGVVMDDVEGRAVQMNRAYRELFALERGPAGYESLPALERARLLHTRDAATGATLPVEDVPVARALRGEVVAGPAADLRMRAFDGRELEVNASAVPIREPDGRIVGAVSVLRDRTERRRLEREHEAARADELAAREVSRRMEEFLATAAHDLRSPLTATIGFLGLAERQTDQLASAAQEACPDLASRVAAVRGRLEDADQSTARLTRLLTRLFDTAAIRAGRLELHRAPCDLAGLVREQVAALRVAAPDRTITLHEPAAGAPIPVDVDADRIGQVLTNYVTNALKYSPPDRPVDVSVTARGNRALVTVRDQGPGLPKEEQAGVWELFHRASGIEVQSRTQGGSLGLGLHIAKAIITSHGGRVGVKSAVGNGCTFWFTLPLASPGESP